MNQSDARWEASLALAFHNSLMQKFVRERMASVDRRRGSLWPPPHDEELYQQWLEYGEPQAQAPTTRTLINPSIFWRPLPGHSYNIRFIEPPEVDNSLRNNYAHWLTWVPVGTSTHRHTTIRPEV